MIEIKFRCFYKIDNTMLEVSEINFTGNAITPTCLFWSPELGLHEAPIEFERDFELMQYTGLKDKHGIEIYEGDILKYGSCVEVVFYEPTMGRFMTKLKKCNDESEIGEISSLSPYYTDNYEVIGNIYQHKDLLK